MQIRCPDCESIFRAEPRHLREADGMVRCGQCSKVFNALDHVVESSRKGVTQTDLFAPAPDHEEVEEIEAFPVEPGLDGREADDEQWAENLLQEEYEEEIAEEGGLPPSLLHQELETQLDVVRPHSSLPWVSGAIVLVLILIGQAFYFNRAQLVQNPGVHQFLSNACEALGCEIDPLRDVKTFELVDRNIYTHPNDQEALVITATFRSNAPFAQPYPLLQVSLTNLQGKVVASRRFIPADYLKRPPDNALLKPGIPVSVTLEVIDPGTSALAFEFDFF